MVWNGSGALTCGAVEVRLFAFDLETPAIAKIGPNRDVRAWLKEWTGVSIYRDSFRVWPYGEPHDDWLRLDQRRVNNPTVCLSNNQIIGFVEIGRQTNPELVDQTNREGIIQSRAFDDLRRLVHFVLQQLEQDRLTRRHPVERRPEPRQAPAQASIVDKLTELVGHLPKVQGREAQSLVRDVREHVEREEGNYKAFVSGYSELAAVGQAVPGILGAIDPLLREVQREVDTLRKLLAGQKSAAVTRSLRTIADGCTGIEKRLQVLSPMQGNHSVRRRAIDVVETLKALVKHFAPLLEERDVTLNIEEPEGLARAEIRPENLYRVLHILVTNSLDWLQGTKGAQGHHRRLDHGVGLHPPRLRQWPGHPRGNPVEGVRADVHGPRGRTRHGPDHRPEHRPGLRRRHQRGPRPATQRRDPEDHAAPETLTGNGIGIPSMCWNQRSLNAAGSLS
jgi:signal transduction histidine kinase